MIIKITTLPSKDLPVYHLIKRYHKKSYPKVSFKEILLEALNK